MSPLALAVAIALAALAVRCIGLQLRPLWLDEAYTAWFSARGWHELWTVVPTYETHPPLYYSLAKLWRGLFGADPVALRSLSVLLGLLAVPVVAAAARSHERLAPTGRPLLHVGMAAFLCACSPMLVFLDQEARPYPFMVLSYAVAVLGLLRLQREFAAGGAGRLPSWAIFAGGTEFVLWSHSLGLLYAACLAAGIAPAWLIRPMNRARLVRGAAAAALLLLAYVPCLMIVLARAADWRSGWLGWNAAMPFELLQLYTVPVEVFGVGAAIAAVAMLLLAKRAIGFALRVHGWNADRALLVLWLGPPLLAVLISSLWMPIFLLRTLGATLVPAFLALAAALARTGVRRERLILAGALIATLLPVSLQVALRPATERWDAAANFLAANVRPGDTVWFYPNDSALPLRSADPDARYATRGIPGDYPALGFKGPIRAGSPAVVSLNPGQAASLAAHAPPTGTIWLVRRQSAIFDPSDEVPRALAAVRRQGRPTSWGYIEATPYYAR
jgi:hypothetical protein